MTEPQDEGVLSAGTFVEVYANPWKLSLRIGETGRVLDHFKNQKGVILYKVVMDNETFDKDGMPLSQIRWLTKGTIRKI